MTRGKFRLLIGISLVCQLGALILRHNTSGHVDAEDFLRGMGLSVMVGAMILMIRKVRVN